MVPVFLNETLTAPALKGNRWKLLIVFINTNKVLCKILYMPENSKKTYLCNVKSTYQNSYPLSNVDKFIYYRTYTYQICN